VKSKARQVMKIIKEICEGRINSNTRQRGDKDGSEHRNPRIRTKCKVTRGYGNRNEDGKITGRINLSPTSYRPNPIGGPSGIPNCCSHEEDPTESTPSTAVAPFATEVNIDN